MKFFNTRIVTKTVQLGDALKAEPKAQRSLDEILADAKKGQVKTASSDAQVKTATPETEQKAEVKAEVKPEAKAEVKEAKAEVKAEVKPEAKPEAKAEAKAEVKEAKKKLPPEFLENIKGKGKKEDKSEKKEDKKEDKEAKAAPRTLKMASSLDFRQWEAEDVVRAWGQHGSHEKCVANVKDLVNEPAAYCKLLQVASDKAASIVKTASKKEATKKQASPKGVFKKLAKLSDEEASFLKEYWRNLYGDAYVESMMKDY